MSRKQWMIAGSALATVCVVVLVVVLLAGGGEDSSDAAPAGAPGVPFGQASEELEDCLAEQGVDPGSGPPGGAPDSDTQEAFRACQQYLPEPPEGGQFPTPPDGGGFTPPTS